MNKPLVSLTLLCLAFTGIGLVCGLYAAGDDHADEHADEPGPDHAAAALAPETLRNMGVRVAPAELTTFVRTTAVPAVIVAAPTSRQYLYAPTAGRVAELKAEFGAVARCGEVLVTLLRDPIDRARLTFTQNLLEPEGETLHETMGGYQQAVVELENVVAERERLEEVTGPADNPVIPTGRLIQLRYEERQAQQKVTTLAHELERQGLSEEQIDALVEGEFPPLDVELWRRAMIHNGYWTPLAQRVFEALPEEARRLAWTVATIGELAAGGFLSEALAELVETNEHAKLHFLEIGGLLQRGHGLADIEDLIRVDVFEDVVQVTAPEGAEDWDVEELLVRPGEHVEAGQPLLRLNDPRSLFLRAEPVGGEIGVVMDSVRNGTELSATPMVEGAGPPLEDLTLFRAVYEGTEKVVALGSVTNRPLAERKSDGGRVYRTWQLGEGQRYLLELPEAALENVYVLPIGAVTEDGPDDVVFRPAGDSFSSLPVQVLHRDHDRVVISGDSEIEPGDPLVVSGAFALGLALHAGGGEAEDAHSGHSH